RRLVHRSSKPAGPSSAGFWLQLPSCFGHASDKRLSNPPDVARGEQTQSHSSQSVQVVHDVFSNTEDWLVASRHKTAPAQRWNYRPHSGAHWHRGKTPVSTPLFGSD